MVAKNGDWLAMTSGKPRTLEAFMSMVKDVDHNGEGLTPWEIEFIASFIDNPPKSFTTAQWEKVASIQEKRVK